MSDTKYIVKFGDGSMIAYDNFAEYSAFNSHKSSSLFVLIFFAVLFIVFGLLYYLFDYIYNIIY